MMPMSGRTQPFGWTDKEVKVNKRLEILKEKLAKQEAHVARMVAFDPAQRSIRAAVAIADMYRERVAKLEAQLQEVTK